MVSSLSNNWPGFNCRLLCKGALCPIIIDYGQLLLSNSWYHKVTDKDTPYNDSAPSWRRVSRVRCPVRWAPWRALATEDARAEQCPIASASTECPWVGPVQWKEPSKLYWQLALYIELPTFVQSVHPVCNISVAFSIFQNIREHLSHNFLQIVRRK